MVALLLLSAGCGGGTGIDWAEEGAAVGRGLAGQGQERTPATCAHAIEEYARDVGLPTGDDRVTMQRACERG